MDLIADLRASLRSFRRRPFYPIVAVTILTLGLAAAVTVFTYFNGYSQSFPGAKANGLVRAFGVTHDDPYQNLAYLDFQDYARDASASFAGITAAQPFYAASVRRETMTEVAFLTAVAGNFFSVLDIPMALGRPITPADDQRGAPAVAVISYRWWRRSFGGDPGVLGQTLYLNYRPHTIVGVAAPEFLGITSSFRPDVWIPIAPFRDRYTSWSVQAENRDIPLVYVFARLQDGVNRARGENELHTLAAGLDATYPLRAGPRDIRLGAATWIDPRTRATELPTVRLMLIAAGGLLVLVCANVTNLLLAVATGRLRELAMRSALGASPGRLLRLVLIDNVLLSTIAGAIALGVAAPASARLGSYFARPSVWGADVARHPTVDARVVVFAIAAALLTGLAAGLLPAFRASRRRLVALLRVDATGSSTAPPRIGHWRLPAANDLLVTSQVALSVVLLVVAGLVLRTFASVRGLHSGFADERLVGTHISTSSTGVQPNERDHFFRELARRVAEEPWVQSATIVDFAPLSPQVATRVRFEGGDEPVPLTSNRVIPGFFETLEIGVVSGRTFTEGDTANALPVAIINQAAARRFFPGTNPIGRRVWRPAPDGEGPAYEIVGVVRDAKAQDFLAPPEPVVYFSYPQHAYPTGSALLVKTTIDPAAAVPRLTSWLRSYEPHLAIVNVLPYSEVVRGFLYVQRMNAEFFTALAFLGMALAAVGIFSVVSLMVGRRRREIGVRMAIGARRPDIARLVIARALTPVVVGVSLGLAVALAATRLVRSLLIGVEPTDPVSLVGGAAVLTLAALLAAYVPARRATQVDPVQALRSE
jgi:putative ABC transport system permease protein